MPVKPSELTWEELHPRLKDANEKQAKLMLEAELLRGNQARVIWVMRIYGRYSKLRRAREVKELVG